MVFQIRSIPKIVQFQKIKVHILYVPKLLNLILKNIAKKLNFLSKNSPSR